MSFPRTLLLTRWPPDARYAGGEVLRKIVGLLPHENLRWAYLGKPVSDPTLNLPEHRSFETRNLHWRLQSTSLQYFYVHKLQARRIAAHIVEQIKEFSPELIWVLPELEAVNIGFHLQSMLRIPVHATVFDAHECARLFCVPSLYHYEYMREVKRFFGVVNSIDAVSSELIEHLKGKYDTRFADTIVFPPSIARNVVLSMPKRKPLDTGSKIRRIGFCGASRSSDEQWHEFLTLLGRLPWQFEIEVYAAQDYFHNISCSGNVSVHFRSYVPTEEDLVRCFREKGLDACYLGLWKDKKRALFAKTSLSSKLTTYAAAGLPVIVDAPADSVVWRLVEKYKAGVRCEDLQRLFGDERVWQRMAEGASRLCREHFDLDRNVEQFKQLLCRTAGIRV